MKTPRIACRRDLMATAQSWLDELTDLYTPTSSQFDAARKHRAAIEARLDLVLGVYQMFEIGSLRHGTGVWRYSDADYLVSLKGTKPLSEWTALRNVKEALQARFPLTTIVIRRPAVVCRFSDGDVEVVPGYIAAAGGYSIANPAGGWMLTHPKDHNEYVTKINKQHDGAVKKLARQVKVWKYRRNVPVSSCYLEMRTAKHMAGEQSYVPLWDLYLSLKRMRDANLAAMNDPTGLGSRFGACSSESNREDAMSKLERAVSRALKAKDFAAADDHDKAIEQLKLLFDR
jgi:Second Messenger Oligonucleotide or Dinucleotide Synthetase domain